MNKDLLIKTFKIFSIVLVVLIAIMGIVMFFAVDDANIKGIGVGIAVGVVVGGVISIKYKIPKMYGNKDERTLVITLLTKLISQSVFAIGSYLCFVFTAVGVIVFNSEHGNEFLYYVAGIVLVTVIVDRVVYKVLCNKL